MSNTPDNQRPVSIPQAAQVLGEAIAQVQRVIVGQEHMVEQLMVGLLAKGHILLEGVPGTAKTLAVRTFATVVGGSFARIQFTPDLVPSDIVGTRVYQASRERFDIELGPVFTNFVLADEVNRALAKVQSAMLELMAEKQVSIAGTTFAMKKPFIVIATQNPIESEGVYPLPEAQRDRFMMKVLMGYPSPAEEVAIVDRMGKVPPKATQVISSTDVLGLQAAARERYIDRSVVEYAVNLVLATRAPENFGLGDLRPLVEFGASPRASLALVKASRSLALLRGRSYVLPQDVFDVAPEILRHRLVLTYEALAQDIDTEAVVTRILTTVPAPRVAPSQSNGHGDAYHGTTTDAVAWPA